FPENGACKPVASPADSEGLRDSGVRDRRREQRTAEFGGERLSLTLNIEQHAHDLPIAGLPEPKAAWFEALMIEPCPHAVHLLMQIVFGDRHFGDITHGISLSRTRINGATLTLRAAA